MSTMEELESQVDWIVNRYKDIDKEKKQKAKKYKDNINDFSFYIPFVIFVMAISFAVGMLSMIKFI